MTRASDASLAPAPTVSIVIPTHDRRPMLEEAVASALAQREVDVEVIVVDDDSSDDTEAWLASQRDPRLSHHRLHPGRGGSGARNVGLAACRGDLVLFLDDDDVLRAGAVAHLRAALDRHPASARSVGAHQIFGEGMRRRRGLHPRVPITTRSWHAELFRWNMPPGAMLWRTDVVREIGGWTEGLRRAEDAELCLRAWRWPTTVVPTTVLDYRCHPTQAQTATTWPLDWEARRHFVDRLDGRMRDEAEALLDSRERSQVALEDYLAHRFWRAACGFAGVVRRTPRVALSPLTGPWVLAFLVKSVLGAALPAAIAGRVSSARRRRRGQAPDMRRTVDPSVGSSP